MAGVPVNSREPADEHAAIELERAEDVARQLDRIESRLEALEAPKEPTEVVEDLLGAGRRAQVREIFDRLDAWIAWGRRLEAELEAAVRPDDVLGVLDRLAAEGVELLSGRAG